MNRTYEIPRCETCGVKTRSVFAGLTNKESSRINSEKSTNIYKHGQILFYEGNHPAGVYCIKKGKVKVYKTDLDGKEHIVRLAKDGDIVGYLALVGNEPYTATSIAIEDSVICFIPESIFHEYLTCSSKFPKKIMEIMFEELKLAEVRAMELAHKPVRQRVAEAILLIKDFYGFCDDGKTVNSTLTRIDIANIAGACTETTIRFLSDFKYERLVDFEGKKIKILNLEGLKKVSEVFHPVIA